MKLFHFGAAKRGYQLYWKWRHLAYMGMERTRTKAIKMWYINGRHKAKYGRTL